MVSKKIIEIEEVMPSEIANATGISRGSALDISRDPTLKKLVSKNPKGYFIKNHKLREVKSKVDENGRKTTKK